MPSTDMNSDVGESFGSWTMGEVHAQAVVDAAHAFSPDGTLVSRGEDGAFLTDAALITENMVRLAAEGKIAARDGIVLNVQADSICVHGDTRGAVAMASAVRTDLDASGITVRSFA